MATSPSAIRGPQSPGEESSPDSSSPTMSSPSTIAGQSQQSSGQQSGQPTEADRLRSVASEIRDIEGKLNAIAKSYPKSSKECREAVMRVRDVIKSIVRSPGQDQQAGPTMMG